MTRNVLPSGWRAAPRDATPLESLLAPLVAWMRDRPWIADALCAQTDPEAFFPENGAPLDLVTRVCAACSVRVECLEDALDTGEVWFGLRGGLGPKARQRLLAERDRSGVAA